MNGFDRAQASYDAMTPPEYDEYQGYCEECDQYDDEHDIGCTNYGTTQEERDEEENEW